jgi:hypothetical protein
MQICFPRSIGWIKELKLGTKLRPLPLPLPLPLIAIPIPNP